MNQLFDDLIYRWQIAKDDYGSRNILHLQSDKPLFFAHLLIFRLKVNVCQTTFFYK